MSGNRYQNKVALVTGAASGIGRATVEGLTREGARVAFTDIDAAAGRRLESELRTRGADVAYYDSDATSEADVRTLIEQIVAGWGRLDVAITLR